jgi:hypothetical protein
MPLDGGSNRKIQLSLLRLDCGAGSMFLRLFFRAMCP